MVEQFWSIERSLQFSSSLGNYFNHRNRNDLLFRVLRFCFYLYLGTDLQTFYRSYPMNLWCSYLIRRTQFAILLGFMAYIWLIHNLIISIWLKFFPKVVVAGAGRTVCQKLLWSDITGNLLELPYIHHLAHDKVCLYWSTP